jgi:hypothetical protein
VKFEPGNKLAKGGRRVGSGRPTTEAAAAKEAMRRSALDRLTNGMIRAVETLLLHLGSKNENISIRAAESVLELAEKSFERDELEKRIQALEQQAAQQGGNLR